MASKVTLSWLAPDDPGSSPVVSYHLWLNVNDQTKVNQKIGNVNSFQLAEPVNAGEFVSGSIRAVNAEGLTSVDSTFGGIVPEQRAPSQPLNPSLMFDPA